VAVLDRLSIGEAAKTLSDSDGSAGPFIKVLAPQKD
jgi:hypothetical protein